MTYYEIRRCVLNANIYQWAKIDRLCINGIITTTPEVFYAAIGYAGALTAKCTGKELEFFDKLHEIRDSNE